METQTSSSIIAASLNRMAITTPMNPPTLPCDVTLVKRSRSFESEDLPNSRKCPPAPRLHSQPPPLTILARFDVPQIPQLVQPATAQNSAPLVGLSQAEFLLIKKRDVLMNKGNCSKQMLPSLNNSGSSSEQSRPSSRSSPHIGVSAPPLLLPRRYSPSLPYSTQLSLTGAFSKASNTRSQTERSGQIEAHARKEHEGALSERSVNRSLGDRPRSSRFKGRPQDILEDSFVLSEHHVLLIGSEKPTCAFALSLLKSSEFRVTQVDSGTDGLRAISEHELDLIIAPSQLPDMDLVTMLEILRFQLASPLPVIVLYLDDDTNLRSRSTEFGGVDMIQFPLCADNFRSLFRNILHTRWLEKRYKGAIQSWREEREYRYDQVKEKRKEIEKLNNRIDVLLLVSKEKDDLTIQLSRAEAQVRRLKHTIQTLSRRLSEIEQGAIDYIRHIQPDLDETESKLLELKSPFLSHRENNLQGFVRKLSQLVYTSCKNRDMCRQNILEMFKILTFDELYIPNMEYLNQEHSISELSKTWFSWVISKIPSLLGDNHVYLHEVADSNKVRIPTLMSFDGSFATEDKESTEGTQTNRTCENDQQTILSAKFKTLDTEGSVLTSAEAYVLHTNDILDPNHKSSELTEGTNPNEGKPEDGSGLEIHMEAFVRDKGDYDRLSIHLSNHEIESNHDDSISHGISARNTGGFPRSLSEIPYTQPKSYKYRDDDFDIFDVNDEDLAELVEEIFSDMNIIKEFSMDRDTLRYFVICVNKKYHQNPYHSFRHAFDVLQTCYQFLIKNSTLCSILTPINRFALLVAALCHDIDHPGYNNAYQISILSPLAVLYNDESVLENHHCACTFSILQDSNANILSTLTGDQFRLFRNQLIQLILATDITAHFELWTKLNAKIVLGTGFQDNINDQTLLMKILLHAADLSNFSKSQKLSKAWGNLLHEEYLKQGDMEKAYGIPVSPYMDRDNTSQDGLIIALIDFIIFPIYDSLNQLSPEGMEPYRKNLIMNRSVWSGEDFVQTNLFDSQTSDWFNAPNIPERPHTASELLQSSEAAEANTLERPHSVSSVTPVPSHRRVRIGSSSTIPAEPRRSSITNLHKDESQTSSSRFHDGGSQQREPSSTSMTRIPSTENTSLHTTNSSQDVSNMSRPTTRASSTPTLGGNRAQTPPTFNRPTRYVKLKKM